MIRSIHVMQRPVAIPVALADYTQLLLPGGPVSSYEWALRSEHCAGVMGLRQLFFKKLSFSIPKG